RWIIERCMMKDPEDRYASTRDLARDLQSLRDHLSETSGSETKLSEPRRKRTWLRDAIALAIIVVLASALFVVWKNSSKQTTASFFHRLTYRRGTITSARFAADGHTVVYSAAWEGNPSELFLTRTEGLDSRSLGLKDADVLSISRNDEMAV